MDRYNTIYYTSLNYRQFFVILFTVYFSKLQTEFMLNSEREMEAYSRYGMTREIDVSYLLRIITSRNEDLRTLK